MGKDKKADLNDSSRKKPTRFLVIIMIALAGLIAVALGVGYFLISYTPATYDPITLTRDQAQQAEQAGWRKANDYYNQVHELRPFTIELSQELINSLLLMEQELSWLPVELGKLQEVLTQPQISIDEEEIYIMGRLGGGTVAPVVSLGIRPRVVGEVMEVELTGMKIGALPVAAAMVNRELTKLPNYSDNKALMDSLVRFFRRGRLRVPNHYQAVEDKRARVTQIDLQPGRVLVRLEPYVKRK